MGNLSEMLEAASHFHSADNVKAYFKQTVEHYGTGRGPKVGESDFEGHGMYSCENEGDGVGSIS